jgi:hypothetical protein
MGAKDRLPRRPSGWAKSNFERIKEQVDDSVAAEFLYSDPRTKTFAGTAADFLVAVYKAEQLPIKIRMWAAREALQYEPDPTDGALLDQLFGNATIMDELEANNTARVKERDATLRQWIEDGRVAEATAVAVRNLYTVGERVPVWEPLPSKPVTLLPPPEPEPEQAPESAENGSEPHAGEPDVRHGPPYAPASAGPATLPEPWASLLAPEPEPAAEPEPSPADVWLGSAPHQRTAPLTLYGPPFGRFQGANGTLYIDNEGTGIVSVVDENDARIMLRNGYSARAERRKNQD